MLTGEKAIEVINERFGRHPGFRALHAKGAFYSGTFTATPVGAGLTRAAHMQGEPVETTIRFSNGSGHPTPPDYAPDVRGMATTFHLPDDSRTDIVAQTSPRHPIRTPEAFLELLRASRPGPAALWRMPLFLARNPHVVPGLRGDLASLKPPTSYATVPYFAIHAYKWVDGAGGERWVRYTWVPETSEPRLAVREAKQRGADYLQDEIRERLERGPARFTLELQIAGPEDDPHDPSAQWPAERQTVSAGTLEVTRKQSEDEADDGIVFDPVRVSDGIELSEDPVLLFRPQAYTLSHERRTAGG